MPPTNCAPAVRDRALPRTESTSAGPRRLRRRRRARVGVDHEHPLHGRPAGERRRQGGELVGVRLEQVQRQLEARADRHRGLLRCLERLAPVAAVEAHLDAQVRGGEHAEQLALTGVGPMVITVLAEPYRRHAGARRAPTDSRTGPASTVPRARRPA